MDQCFCRDESVCASCEAKLEAKRLENEKKLDAEVAAFESKRRKFRASAGTAKLGDTYGWNGQPLIPPAWRF